MASKIRHKIAKIEKNPNKQRDAFEFKDPARIIVAGASGTGKSVFVIDYFFRYPPKAILWITPESSMGQPKLELLKHKFKDYLHFMHEIDAEAIDEIIEHYSNEGINLHIVLDDMIHNNRNKYIQKLFTSCRHQNVTLWNLLQKVFFGNNLQRCNANYFVLFKFPEKSESQALFKAITSNKHDAERLAAAYKVALQQDHGCLIIDQTSRSTELLPLRVRMHQVNAPVKELWDV
jgi:hypothetical protein